MKKKDKAKQIIPTVRAIYYKQVRTGLVATLCRTSTSTTNIPISPNAPVATNIVTNTSQTIQASTTTTAAAAPIPTVHDSTVPQKPPPLQTTDKSKPTTPLPLPNKFQQNNQHKDMHQLCPICLTNNKYKYKM